MSNLERLPLTDIEISTVEAALGAPGPSGGRINATPDFVRRLIDMMRAERARADAAEATLRRLETNLQRLADSYALRKPGVKAAAFRRLAAEPLPHEA